MRHSIRSCGALGLGFFFMSVVWVAAPLYGQAARAATAPAEAAAKIDQLIVGEMSGAAAETKSAAKKSAKAAGAYPTDDSSASTAAKPHASAGPTRLSDDETFLRRATMDLVGHPPTPKDITAFALDPSPEKRVKAIDRLLTSSDFGENWGRYWRDVIMYRKADDRAMLVAPAIESYLAEEFNKDTPWDKIARSFITATGDVRENGVDRHHLRPMAQAADVTAEVSRIFMGVQIQCAQCHDHPTDRWKRNAVSRIGRLLPTRRCQGRKGAAKGKQTFIVYGADRDRGGKKNNNAAPECGTLHAGPEKPDRQRDADAAGVLSDRPEAARRYARRRASRGDCPLDHRAARPLVRQGLCESHLVGTGRRRILRAGRRHRSRPRLQRSGHARLSGRPIRRPRLRREMALPHDHGHGRLSARQPVAAFAGRDARSKPIARNGCGPTSCSTR